MNPKDDPYVYSRKCGGCGKRFESRYALQGTCPECTIKKLQKSIRIKEKGRMYATHAVYGKR